MPVWLLKILPYGAAALALGLAVWYIDHRGYERAKEQDQAIEQKLESRAKDWDAKLAKQTTELEGQLQTNMNGINSALGNRIDQIQTTNKTIIQPTITKEIANDPRLSDPANALSDSLWKSLNQARSLSAGSYSAGNGGTGQQAVPAGQPAQ